jgi:hypothetical protein
LFIFIIFTGSKQAKDQQAGLVLEEEDYDSEEDEDYEAEDQEDIALEESFEAEDIESLLADQTEEDMPSSTPSKKRTPKKASTPAGESSVAVITSSMKNMNVNASSPFSFSTVFPYTITTYDEGDDQMCDLFCFVPTLPLEYFLPDVIEKGNVFSLSMRVPNVFFTFKRVLLANKDVKGFNKNTSQAQAYKKVCQTIDNHHGHRDEIFGDPQMVPLPFSCEERIVTWEIQASKNDLGSLTDDLGGQQFHYVLWAKLRKLKDKKRTTGKFRIIEDGDDEMEDEFEDAGS